MKNPEEILADYRRSLSVFIALPVLGRQVPQGRGVLSGEKIGLARAGAVS